MFEAAKARLERAREVQTATACSIDHALLALHHIQLENELYAIRESIDGLETSVSSGADGICERLLRFEEEVSRETGNIAYMLRGIRDGLPEAQ